MVALDEPGADDLGDDGQAGSVRADSEGVFVLEGDDCHQITTHGNVIRVMAPLVVTADEISIALTAVGDALKATA